MNIYGAADLHLKSNIWKSRDDITGDAYAAFAALVKLVIGDPGSVLLLAGDVFDSTSPEGVDEYVFSIGMQKLPWCRTPRLRHTRKPRRRTVLQTFVIRSAGGVRQPPWTLAEG